MNEVVLQHSKAIGVFAVLAIVANLFLVFHLHTTIAGTGGDPWQTMWRMQVKADGGMQAFLQDVTGSGEPRLANLSVWPWIGFHVLFGEPVAYNIVWLIQFVLAGYAMALFIQALTNTEKLFSSAPMLSGIAYMFLPYHIAHSLGHFGAMQIAWIPFICTAFLALERSRKAMYAIILGVLLIIQAWMEHHYILWLGIFCCVAFFFYRKEVIASVKKHLPITILLIGIAFLGIVVPFIPTLKLASGETGALDLGIQQTIRFSADLFAFITPPPFHPLWGDISHGLFGQYFTGNIPESVQYLGITIILGILFFHRHIPVKQKRLWISSIIIFGLIALGPVLHLFGNETSIPLPYAFLAHLPVFSAIRVVSRAGVIVGFSVVVLFGWVLATNKHSIRISVLIACAILVEFAFFPFPTQSAVLSPVYQGLQTVQEPRIIEIPAATNYTAASRALYASAFHKKEVLGNIALERGEAPDIFDLERSAPALRQLLYVRTTDLADRRSEFFGQDLSETLPDVLAWMHVGAIIVHNDSLNASQNDAISSFLSSPGVFSSSSFGDAMLYTWNGKKPQTDGLFLIRRDGWEGVRRDKEGETFAEIPSVASVDVVNITSSQKTVSFAVTLPPESSRLIMKDAAGNILSEKKEGNRVVYTQSVSPGVTTFSFSHTGSDTLTIQNPLFTAQ